MKNSFNSSPLSNGALCGLCQDRLLRHISQSRIFWYCPSCRQEMVCEGQENLTKPPTVTNQVGQLRHVTTKAATHSKPIEAKVS